MQQNSRLSAECGQSHIYIGPTGLNVGLLHERFFVKDRCSRILMDTYSSVEQPYILQRSSVAYARRKHTI